MMAEDHWEIRSEINVTPLVDVCLVLLIVFMVMTPILARGPDVDLPKTAEPRRMEPALNEFPILILFRQSPRVLYGPEYRPISYERLLAEATALYAMDPRRPITLRADRGLPYGAVKHVMQILREAGFVNLGLIAAKANRRADSP